MPRMPHKCHGNGGNCPSRSHPIWELPINELDRRDDPDFDESLTGCHLVSSCSNIYHKDQFRRLLQHNFDRHYSTNKAPLSLSFEASWLMTNKGFLDVLEEWMDHILTSYTDTYFVTGLQVNFVAPNIQNTFLSVFQIPIPGFAMDPESDKQPSSAGFPRLEGEVRCEGAALLLAAQPLPPDHPRAARGDTPPAHLRALPLKLPLDTRPDGGGIRLLDQQKKPSFCNGIT